MFEDVDEDKAKFPVFEVLMEEGDDMCQGLVGTTNLFSAPEKILPGAAGCKITACAQEKGK